MKTLYIRTEANRIIATGHMTRCMAIARSAKALGIKPVFIVAENDAKRMPVENGFEVIVLDRKWDDFDGEIPVITRLIEDLNIKCLLIDSYYVTEKYMAAVNKLTKTAYIDDLHERIWPVGIIINYAVYFDLFDYEKEYPDSEKLLGCAYMPLRAEYSNVEPKCNVNEVKRILVVTGGSDENHFMRGLVSLILNNHEWDSICFKFIVGTFNQDYDEICELSKKGSNIVISPPVPTLKEEILASDGMITAGGTTLYEMCRCQVPGIAVRIADNQHLNVDSFARHGLIIDGGDVQADFSFQEFAEKINQLVKDSKLRGQIITNMEGFLDDNGARRIALSLDKYL